MTTTHEVELTEQEIGELRGFIARQIEKDEYSDSRILADARQKLGDAL